MNMKMMAFLIAFLPSTGIAGDYFATVNLASKHFPYDGENEYNPGVGIGYKWGNDWGVEVGFYENSHKDQTVYGLALYEKELGDSDFYVGAFGGLGTGYYDIDDSVGGVIPLAGIQTRYHFLQVRVAPMTDGVVLGFQLVFHGAEILPYRSEDGH